eukprot:g3368.t1
MVSRALVAFVFSTTWSLTAAFTPSAAAAAAASAVTASGVGPLAWRRTRATDGRSAGVCSMAWRHRHPPPAGGGSCRRHRAVCPPSASPSPTSSSSSSSTASVERFVENRDGGSSRSSSRRPGFNDAASAVSGDPAENHGGRGSGGRRRSAAACVDESRFEPAVCLAAATVSASAASASPPARAAAESGRPSLFHNGVNGADESRRGDPSSAEPSARLMISMRQLSVLGAVAGLAAAAFDYEHGMAGFHWFQDWAVGAASNLPPRAAGNGGGGGGGGELGQVHLTPLKSIATGLGAGFTRALSRTLTFPLDTIKTRSQLSRLGAEDRSLLSAGMRRSIDGPASFDGVFKGFSAFLAQAGPSNAVFFLVYDALKALGTAALLGGLSGGGGGGGSGGGAGGGSSSLLPTALHLGASSIATVPSNLVRTPAEVVKQRLQVGQESGNSLQALRSIVRAEGVKGLFVGGKEQLMREIPFNAVQFAVYECLTSYVGSSELWADAALGAASSAVGAFATQPVDTVKTRVMTKSVPGSFGGASPGFLESAALVVEAEGVSSLFLGLLPRLVLVSTGGAFYFWGQEFASQLMSRAGF